jgi:hypothetical protein
MFLWKVAYCSGGVTIYFSQKRVGNVGKPVTLFYMGGGGGYVLSYGNTCIVMQLFL